MRDSILATLWRWCTHFCYNKLNNGCFGILIYNIIQLTERLLKCHLPCLRIQRKRLLFRKYHDQTYLTFLDSQNSIYEHEAKIVNTYVLQELSWQFPYNSDLVTRFSRYRRKRYSTAERKKCKFTMYLSIFTMSCHLPAGDIYLIWVNGNTEMVLNHTLTLWFTLPLFKF